MTEDIENNDIEKSQKSSWFNSKKEQLGQKSRDYKIKMKEKYDKTIHDQFHGILDKDKLFYTLFFIIVALIIFAISIISVFIGEDLTETVVVISLSFVISYLLMFLIALIPQVRVFMFEQKTNLRKSILILISSVIGLAISLIYLFSPPPPISWLSFNQLLPGIFVVIFFGWNLMQIHFIKTSFQDISMKAEVKLISKQQNESIKNTLSITFLVIGLITPLLLHSLTIMGFASSFIVSGGSTPTLEEFNTQTTFIAWSVFMYVIIIAMGIWQIRLHIKSMKNSRPNVFSNIFYGLIWVILWFRSFGFINTFRSVAGQSGSDIFLSIGNVFLLGLTSIMVLRGLAEKVKKTGIFSEDTIPFLVYTLTVMYVAGQAIMIQGQFGDKNNLDMFNNTILLISGIIYYLWYSNYMMQREGYIQKTLLTRIEVKSIVTELSDKIKDDLPEKNDIIEKNLEKVLENHNLNTVIDANDSEMLEEEELVIDLEDSINEETNFESEEDNEK